MKTNTNLSISDSEFILLNFLAKFNYCQMQHLTKLFSIINLEIKGTTTSLIKKNLIIKYPLFKDQEPFLLLSKNGANLFQLPQLVKLFFNNLEHDMCVIELFLTFLKQNPNIIIQTGQELKREIIPHKFKKLKANIPDLLLNNTIAIEVELTPKSNHRLIEICNSYIANAEIIEVHYYSNSTTILKRVFNHSLNSKKFKWFITNNNFAENIELSSNYFQPAMAINYSYNLDNYLS